MERRLHTRHRARTTVYILFPDGQRRLCKAVNLSATGVFIRTAGLGLRKGQQVISAFAIDLVRVTCCIAVPQWSPTSPAAAPA